MKRRKKKGEKMNDISLVQYKVLSKVGLLVVVWPLFNVTEAAEAVEVVADEGGAACSGLGSCGRATRDSLSKELILVLLGRRG